MTLGGAFSDTIIQIAATVSAGVLIACVIAAVRFTMHVRDSVKKQDEVLEHIGKAVNHVPPGEPRLYDLVAEVSDQAAEAAQSAAEAARTMRIMRGTVEQHLHDDEERFARQDVVLDEVRGVVLDLRDKGEVNAAALDSINDKVIDLSVTVEGLTAE